MSTYLHKKPAKRHGRVHIVTTIGNAYSGTLFFELTLLLTCIACRV